MPGSVRIFAFAVAALTLNVAAPGQVVRVDITGEIAIGSFRGADRAELFQGEILLPMSESREVFTGPYSLRLNAIGSVSDSITISADFFGLGPDFKTSNYTMHLATGDTIFTPPLPVKDSTFARYRLILFDDTSSTDEIEPAPDDTSAWGRSESVHYATRWLRGSLADFMWNLKMAYMEQIYDRHRHSFSLSSFDKINLVFHPEPTDRFYLDPELNYSLSPRLMRVDAVFSHDIDAISPRLGIELLLYRQWGYGPRWMITGFGGFYSDNFLRLRNLAKNLSSEKLVALLRDESRAESDTARIITGGFVRWLLEQNTILKFMNLYKRSTILNFESVFEDIYGKSIGSAADDFLAYAANYKPQKGELEYYASLYMNHGKYDQAREYLEEIVNGQDFQGQSFRTTLAICQYWLGDYADAAKPIGQPNVFSHDCCDDIFRTNMLVADGSLKPSGAYFQCANEERCGEAILNLAIYYLDEGKALTAETLLASIDSSFMATPEYLIAAGRLMAMKAFSPDSILSVAAAIASARMRTTAHDPINYLVAGQAYLYKRDLSRAGENLETAYFLERRPYFQGQILLELGRLYDLKGERDKALEYYNEVLIIKAGAYEKSLAKKYIARKFEIKS